jgi:hypothetical protein
METKKNFAVRVYDTTCNNYNHESGIYGKDDYSWADETISNEYANYDLTKDEAENLKKEFEDYAKKHNLDWAAFEVEELPFTYDVCFDDDTDSNSKGWEQTYDYCLSYIRMYNGTNESYFKDYKGGVVSIYCNETDEDVYQEIIK